jgi:titin
MLAVRRCYLGSALLVLGVVGCDGNQPIEPAVQAASTGKAGPTVTAPSNTNTVAVSESRIDISWQDNSPNESGFEVHRSTAGASGAFALLATTGAGVTSHSEAGLTPSTQHCYKVRAFKRADGKTSYSDFSTTACATTPAPPVPTAPSGADAKPANSTSVDVRWIDNATNEDGFRVERSLDLGSNWATVRTVGANVTSSLDGGRSSEQQVCYRVIAFNAGGDSPPSNTDCTTPPAAPSGLTATGTSQPAIDLAWMDNSVVEDGYEVRRAPEGMAYSTLADLPASSTTYRDVAVTSDARYSYMVRAKKDGGFSDNSNIASAIVPSGPPNAPSEATATPWSSTEVSTRWIDNSTNETGFHVERSTDGGARWETAGTKESALGGFTDGGRTPEQQVCYRVIASNSLGDSPPSNTACTTPPAGPTNLTGTLVDEQTIHLTWTDNSAVEDGYELGVLTWCSQTSDPVFLGRLPANSTAYTGPTEVFGCGIWMYYLWATKDGGYSDYAIW